LLLHPKSSLAFLLFAISFGGSPSLGGQILSGIFLFKTFSHVLKISLTLCPFSVPRLIAALFSPIFKYSKASLCAYASSVTSI
jgi:hypothetical protein